MSLFASRSRRGFTLVELLVVIGIIALLISILLPALRQARESANLMVELSNMRQVGLAIHMYGNDHDGIIVAMNNNHRKRDHFTARNRLYRGYLQPGFDESNIALGLSSALWGCPLAGNLSGVSNHTRHARSWWWNLGGQNSHAVTKRGAGLSITRKSAFDEDGSHPDRGNIYLDGRGFTQGGSPYERPSDIVVFGDAGTYAPSQVGGVSIGSVHHPELRYDVRPPHANSWILDGHATRRPVEHLQRVRDGSEWGYR